jgi:hypothetical protein
MKKLFTNKWAQLAVVVGIFTLQFINWGVSAAALMVYLAIWMNAKYEEE